MGRSTSFLSYRADAGEVSTSAAPDLFNRIDFGRLDGTKVTRSPAGGLRIPAALTREGVFTYRNTDGSVRREYRPADEVFKADALASLEDAPVTDLHPSEMVNTKNFATLAKGHAREIKQDGKFVAANVVVNDADLVSKVDAGERKEISCGYTCKLDMTPGVSPDGEAYDAIQRGIVYNHVALLPVGTGRAGREVALRLDAAFQDVPTPAAPPAEKVITIVKITFDGKEYVKGSDEHLAAIEAKAAADVKAAEERATKADADAKAATERADAAEKPAREAARKDLETKAAKVLGAEYKFDGKTDEQIRLDVANKTLETPERSDAGSARVAAVLSQTSTPVTSAEPAAPVKPLWDQPLAASKNK